jgi:hypothetical protein
MIGKRKVKRYPKGFDYGLGEGVIRGEGARPKSGAPEEEVVQPAGRTKFLFCMKKVGKHDRNQWIDVRICQNQKCGYLEEIEGDEKMKCTCPTSLVYISTMKKLDKGEMDHIKREHKEDRRLEEVEEGEENE